MAKSSTVYVCSECGVEYMRWQGQCNSCQLWNTLKSFRLTKESPSLGSTKTSKTKSSISLREIQIDATSRITTYAGEFNRVLGGGLVQGSVVLIGGHPGAGKSTLLLKTVAELAKSMLVLYVSGEESTQQIALRASRLGCSNSNMRLLIENNVETIIQLLLDEKPAIAVIDSVQILFSEQVSGSPGGVSQVRECVTALARHAKEAMVTLILVGHVTKEGSLAGPKVLEHCVDCSISMDTSTDNRFRTLRALKNRFGTVNELGIFAMTGNGLKEVPNPSAIFLSDKSDQKPGTMTTVIWEGSRPILIEIQSLVDEAGSAGSRRLTLGIDTNRLIVLLAVLHKHTGISLANHDVFVSIVGGVRINETSSDLALIMAAISSLRNKPLPVASLAFGELGLNGEVRPVAYGLERIKEAFKHGFSSMIVPRANAPKKKIKGLSIHPVANLCETLDLFKSNGHLD